MFATQPVASARRSPARRRRRGRWAGCPAHACSCVAELDAGRTTKQAADVFTGTVTDVARTGSARRGTVTYDVDVRARLQGRRRAPRPGQRHHRPADAGLRPRRPARRPALRLLRQGRRHRPRHRRRAAAPARPAPGWSPRSSSCSAAGRAAGRPRRRPRGDVHPGRRRRPASVTRLAAPGRRPGARRPARPGRRPPAGPARLSPVRGQRYMPPDSPGRCGSAAACGSSTAGCPPTPGGQRAAHLLELRPRGHLLGVDRGLDAVEEALEPADQLGLGDPQLGVGRRARPR